MSDFDVLREALDTGSWGITGGDDPPGDPSAALSRIEAALQEAADLLARLVDDANWNVGGDWCGGEPYPWQVAESVIAIARAALDGEGTDER